MSKRSVLTFNTRYLCEYYDSSDRLLPKDKATRAKVLRWVHAAEATYALHSLAILYTRWQGAFDEPVASKIEEGMSVNVGKDFDFLEGELSKNGTKFLAGDHVTAADIMMQFSIDFILARNLGTKGRKWENIERWLKDCKATETYKKAVEKTGHKL